MDRHFRKQLYVWTYEKIKSNPKVYGGDHGNPLIILAYLKEMGELNRATISHSVAVSRIKNKLLRSNPHFDYRQKYKPKKSLE